MDWPAITLSLRLAALTTAIVLAVGIPLAYWLSVSKFRGKWIIESIVTLPLVLPPTVLGFYVLLSIAPHAALGEFYRHWTGDRLSFTFSGLLLGSVIYSLPFALQPFIASLSAIDRAQVEASWCLGVSRIGTLFRLVLPLCFPGILSGCILAFAHTLGEFGIVMMIGGNIPGETRTLSISIYDSVQALDYGAANRNALLLLGFSFLVLASTGWLKHRRSWEGLGNAV